MEVIKKISAAKERSIISYCVMETQFLSKMRGLVQREFLKSDYSWTVFSWCAEYFDAYGIAPKDDIQHLYSAHRDSMDDEDASLIAKFLHSLSSTYEPPSNVSYQIEQAEAFLTLRNAELVKENLEIAIAAGDLKALDKAFSSYKEVRARRSTFIDAMEDDDEIISAFTEESQELFRFSGALGKVAGSFCRGDFTAWQAFAKVGKTAALIYTATQAMMHGNRVLFVSFEMPKEQILRRFWTGLTGKPRYKKEIKIPYFVKDEEFGTGKYRLEFKEETREAFSPTKEDIFSWRNDFRKYFHNGDMKVESMSRISIKELLSYFDSLEMLDGFLPDVIVLDYADLIGSTQKETRHQLDDVWKSLRQYALLKNICIVTASQSGRGASAGESTVETIAEDIRKVAHVTKLLSINATKEERANGLIRIANLAERDGESVFDHAYVTQCLDIGMPVLDSRFRSEVYIDKGRLNDE